MQEDVTILAQMYRLLGWYENNRKQAVIGAAIVAAVALAVGYYIWNKGQTEVNAAKALSAVTAQFYYNPPAANSLADDYQKVAEDFSGTGAAGQALLQAGVALFTQGKFDEARALFERVLRDYPDNILSPEAELGVASCFDAQGREDDALAAYNRVIDAYPDSNAVAQAKFSKARIWESQNKLADAANLYEEIMRTYGLNNSIGSEAGIRADELRRRITVAGAPATATVPAVESRPFSLSDFTKSLTNILSAKQANGQTNK